MESIVKVQCSRAQLDEVLERNLINVRFFQFDVDENGFDPRMWTVEQELEERDEPWIWVLRVRHADFGSLNDRYASIKSLLSDINRRGNEYVRKVKILREEYREGRRKEAVQ